MKQFFNYRDFEALPIMRCEFEPVFLTKIKKAINIFLIILVGIVFTLSIICITKWFSFDSVYQQGLTDAMRSKNGLKNKITYAGVGNQGMRKMWEKK